LTLYAELCGWTLARAYSKAGDPWMIGFGGKNTFDEAIGAFAIAYAHQASPDLKAN
jgi:hypothetical protein